MSMSNSNKNSVWGEIFRKAKKHDIQNERHVLEELKWDQYGWAMQQKERNCKSWDWKNKQIFCVMPFDLYISGNARLWKDFK